MKTPSFYQTIIATLLAVMAVAAIGMIASCRYVTIVYYTPPEKSETIMTWEEEYKPTPAFEWFCPIDPGFYKPINNGQLLITPNENLRVTPYTLEGISFDTLNIDR